MKKIITIIFIMALMSMNFNVRAEAITPNSLTAGNATEDVKEAEDGIITLELLEEIPSWDVLVNATEYMGDYNEIENKEDYHVVVLIFEIIMGRTRISTVYHDAEYLCEGYAGIKLKEVNYERLIKKFQTIINIYNQSNELQLVLTPKILNDTYMQIQVESTNSIDMRDTARKVGQSVVLKAGANCWESSWNDGSGKNLIATNTNSCIPNDYIVTVNGFAYLDESRTNIVTNYYKPYDKIGNEEMRIDLGKRRMLHICTETTDLGWVYPEDVKVIEE